MAVRIVPRLDIKGPNLVKGIQFEGLRVLGKPEYYARHYYENGADEMLYMDAVASLYGRNSLLDIVEKTSKEIFIPLTVGGGLRTVEDIRTVLRAGADKVSINTAAINDPELIRNASRSFGSSTIVVSLEVIRKNDGSYEAYTDYGRERTGVDPFGWALKAAELGAGELMLTSINRDGTGKGFDVEFTRKIAEAVDIPVIASGGAGTPSHVAEVVTLGKADAVCVASMLHYGYIRTGECDPDAFSQEGNIEFLRGLREGARVRGASIQEVKRHLVECGIDCRFED